MKRFKPHYRLAFLALWAFAVFPVALSAEQPPASPETAAELRKTPAPPRVKPQVIYHLPRASAYAATLHSQAKDQRDALPIDNDMPISLQMSRERANAPSAEVPAQLAPKPSVKPPTIRATELTRPHSSSRRSNHAAAKIHGPGNSHANKPRKN
ncbi:MAG: hypothetical protein DLM73_02880 [Chthoniobacterales bacterium]|nr:MAG: hypothetical protein DLM73_02880 [Chthoniobacterales bacterium]